MVKVAVHTALKHTSLVPHLLYDGRDNALTDWLRKQKVAIIPCRTPFFDQLREVSQKKQDPQILAIGAGAFLRVELPKITHELGMDDTYVLYTDCDVMFMKEVAEDLKKIGCRYFAVAPEFNPKDYQHMNTGVMLMNLENLVQVDERFRDFVISNLEKFPCWDQSAYQWFYKSPRKKLFGRHGWDRLPMSLTGSLTGEITRGENSTFPWPEAVSKRTCELGWIAQGASGFGHRVLSGSVCFVGQNA